MMTREKDAILGLAKRRVGSGENEEHGTRRERNDIDDKRIDQY